ncbi:peptide chain release factor N(5)-glutamine methyltransferase [Patescibacteria group bacterium]|nr:MAG: peptide chain release factor N(5)-glutamine methyltransferase [Patescibacteria group bacterium]
MSASEDNLTVEKVFLLREKYHGIETNEYIDDVKKLARGVPLAYVIGWIPFLNTKIFLDSHPLIPRSETEFWVEKAITTLSKNARAIRVLDLFAGSGCIGVAVLHHIPNSRVDFGELEVRHMTTIQKNIAGNNIDPARTQLFETNVWSNINDTYDVVFANPPYLAKSRIDRVEVSVGTFEPSEALFADEDGFLLIRETLEGLTLHLNPGGILYLEHEPEHEQTLKMVAEERGFEVNSYPDQFEITRFSTLTLRTSR